MVVANDLYQPFNTLTMSRICQEFQIRSGSGVFCLVLRFLIFNLHFSAFFFLKAANISQQIEGFLPGDF